MRFIKVSDGNLRADKLSGNGAVYYSVWQDEHQKVYVRVEANVVNGVKKKGSFSKAVFCLSEVVDTLTVPINGFRPENGEPFSTSDNDMPGFLKAIRNEIARSAQSLTPTDEAHTT